MAEFPPAPVAEGFRPLAGLRVVELSSYVATPLLGLTLVQLGAEVIRVEPLGGAPDRGRWPVTDSGVSLYWSGLNRGKRSLAVDLDGPRGVGLVVDLVASPPCGVLVTNTDRYPELGYERLAARRPDVVHALLTGRSDGTPSVDYLVQARSGLPFLTGHPSPQEELDPPVNQVLPAWDLLAGNCLAVALLAALHRRAATGVGAQLQLALEDLPVTALTTLGWYPDVVRGGVRTRLGNEVYGTTGFDVATSDGARFMLVVLTPRHLRDLLRRTGLEAELAGVAERLGVDLADEGARFEHRDAVRDPVRRWFAARTREQARADLASATFLWEEYASFEQAADRALHHPLVTTVDQPGVGEVMASRSPVRAGREAGAAPGAAPAVGADGEHVLRDCLGLSEAEQRALVQAGVVGGAVRGGPGGPAATPQR